MPLREGMAASQNGNAHRTPLARSRMVIIRQSAVLEADYAIRTMIAPRQL